MSSCVPGTSALVGTPWNSKQRSSSTSKLPLPLIQVLNLRVMICPGSLQIPLKTPRCYIDRPLFLLFKLSSQFFCILLEVSVRMRFPGLSTDLLRHHPKELVGCLDRGIVEPGDVAAGRHRVLCVALLLHILHQLLM